MTKQAVNIVVEIASQRLLLRRGDQMVGEFPISTAKNGAGQQQGSECTPLGRHQIRAMIGAQAPLNSVFVARRATGEIYSSVLAAEHPGRDWILTRILWLSGLEPGLNRFGSVDTMQRYIYIHGTPESEPMGEPLSHGCVRMRNHDLIELFDQIEVGTEVVIVEQLERD